MNFGKKLAVIATVFLALCTAASGADTSGKILGTANLQLEGGEEIRVPDAGRVYIVGNVKKPGAFPVRDSNETSVLRMLALSEGVLPYASNAAYIYRREGSSSGKNEIPIDLKGIIERKSPDISLLPNDVLYIPDNVSRRKTMTAIDRILTFGAGTASGLLVLRGH